MRGGAGAEDLRDRAVGWSTLMWRALKRVLLRAVGQSHGLGEMELTYIPQKENLSSGYVWRRGHAMRYDVPVRMGVVLTLSGAHTHAPFPLDLSRARGLQY